MSVFINQLPILDAIETTHWLIIDTPGETKRVSVALLESYLGNVKTVNSKTPTSGNVNLTADDISDVTSDHKFVTAAQLTKLTAIMTSGDGTKFLADDGTYKLVATTGGGGGGIWGGIIGILGDQEDLATALGGKAPVASPAFSGTPTAPTADPGTNTTQLATTAFVTGAINTLIGAAPGALDTLNELAAALNDNENFASEVLASVALKAPVASPTFTGTPSAPTPAVTTDSTQIATTAFVHDVIDEPIVDMGTVSTGTVVVDGDHKNHKIVLTGNVTLDHSSIVPGREYKLFVERATNTTITWATGQWAAPMKQAPVLTNPTTNGTITPKAIDLLTITRRSASDLPLVVITPDIQNL